MLYTAYLTDKQALLLSRLGHNEKGAPHGGKGGGGGGGDDTQIQSMQVLVCCITFAVLLNLTLIPNDWGCQAARRLENLHQHLQDVKRTIRLVFTQISLCSHSRLMRAAVCMLSVKSYCKSVGHASGFQTRQKERRATRACFSSCLQFAHMHVRTYLQ